MRGRTMFEAQTVENHANLYEGAYVRLDVRWHHNPVFLCERDGDHFRIAGYEYTCEGKPLKAHVPTPDIAGVLPKD